jgi:hypothetical protein
VVGWHVVGDKVDDSYYAGSCKERGRERERERECIGQRNWRKVLEIRRCSFSINISAV